MVKAKISSVIIEKTEDFSNQLNGIKTQFVLSIEPIISSLRLYRNGVLQSQNSDYLLSGKIIIILFKAHSDSKLEAIYKYRK